MRGGVPRMQSAASLLESMSLRPHTNLRSASSLLSFGCLMHLDMHASRCGTLVSATGIPCLECCGRFCHAGTCGWAALCKPGIESDAYGRLVTALSLEALKFGLCAHTSGLPQHTY